MTIDVDLWDHDAFQRQEHHDMLAGLRETDPGIHWVDEGEVGPGYWAITRQAHLKEVNRQADIFSSNARGTQMTEPDFDNPMSKAMNEGLMIELDAPKHTRFRRIVSRGFRTPRMINLLEDYLQNRTDSIIDKVCERGQAEFVQELSSELPLQAIAEMVGIPIEDRAKIFDWTNRMIGGQDPDFVEEEDEAIGAAAELFGVQPHVADGTP